ncbi:uncharacterized protein LOC135688380 [Rhopilema esculentum]|uniref:uncharacterized protein LOC135688380 n=1 Tax=Rhopilema esculentum TaxID=499914 RepID=UPI0031D39A84
MTGIRIWLSKCANGCRGVKEDVLSKLRRIARSISIAESERAIDALKRSVYWEDKAYAGLVDYIERYWLSIKKRWIWAYRQERLLLNCNTNNGTERQNESFKYQYLQKHSRTSVTGMLSILVEDFFVDKYEKYREMNLKFHSNYRRYANDIPLYLQNRPHSMVRHCMERNSAAESISKSSIKIVGNGEFHLKSTNPVTLEPHLLLFGDENNMPHCSCYDWRTSAYPCKHFFAVFEHYPAWSWEALPTSYKNSVFLILDETFDFPVMRSEEISTSSQNDNLISPDEDEKSTDDDEMEIAGGNVVKEYMLLDNKAVDTKKDSNMTSDTDAGQTKESGGHATGPKIRDTLTDIRRLTFLIENKPELLGKLNEKISEIREMLYSWVPKEKGILLRPSVFQQFEKKQNTIKMKSLSLRKRKCPFGGRVGEKREKYVKASKIAISSENGKKQNTTEEVLIQNEQGLLGDEEFSTKAVLPGANDMLNNGEEEETSQQTRLTLRQHLTKADLKSISDHEMLNDTIIHVYQGMIHANIQKQVGCRIQFLVKNFLLAFIKASHLCRYYMMEIIIGLPLAHMTVNQERFIIWIVYFGEESLKK